MINKIINYYKCFGALELIKKINRYFTFSYRRMTANNGVYRLSKKERNNIVLKDKTIYIFTYHNYVLSNKELKELIKHINYLGFRIVYICI